MKNLDLGAIGRSSLESFVKTIQYLLVSEKRNFDLLCGPGDSGYITIKITETVYDLLGLESPPTLVAPIYRHKDYEETILFDNSLLSEEFSWVSKLKANKILCVDDEVGDGTALSGMIDLLSTLILFNNSQITFVAEDGGFSNKVGVEFIPSQERRKGVYNAISYTIPKEFEEPLKKVLADVKDLNDKQIMCVLLGLPTKEFVEKLPHFTFSLQEKASEKFTNLASLQKGYQQYFRSSIEKLL